MAEVAICSLVRDGMAYLPSYRRQLESLTLDAGDTWRLHILEGDSRDDSRAFLEAWAREDARVHVGREDVGDAVEAEDRAARWAHVCNACVDLIPAGGAHTHMLWLEADLCFPPELLGRLLAHGVDVVAPVIWLGGLFYDTWGFRGRDGVRWTNEPPYHADYRPMRLIELNSVGSCVLFDRAVLDAGIRFRPTYGDGLLVGMCNDARARGLRVFADTATAILHPVSHWEAQMWRCESVERVDAAGRATRQGGPELRGEGLDPYLSMLDAGHLVCTQHRFLLRTFKALETNRLAIDVRARSAPRRGYDLRIAHRPPVGGAIGRSLRRRLGKARGEVPVIHIEGDSAGAATPTDLSCSLEITMEHTP